MKNLLREILKSNDLILKELQGINETLKYTGKQEIDDYSRDGYLSVADCEYWSPLLEQKFGNTQNIESCKLNYLDRILI